VPDGQGPILVGGGPELLGHKEVSRHSPHRLEHEGIGDIPSLELRSDHVHAQRIEVGVRHGDAQPASIRVAPHGFQKRQHGLRPGEAGPLCIGDLRAYPASAYQAMQGGVIALDRTWIAHHLRVFRISCATTEEKLGSYRPLFRRTARSFQPLDADERGRFQDTRLRIATARARRSSSFPDARGTPGASRRRP
jgi:hypothetical protein